MTTCGRWCLGGVSGTPPPPGPPHFGHREPQLHPSTWDPQKLPPGTPSFCPCGSPTSGTSSLSCASVPGPPPQILPCDPPNSAPSTPKLFPLTPPNSGHRTPRFFPRDPQTLPLGNPQPQIPAAPQHPGTPKLCPWNPQPLCLGTPRFFPWYPKLCPWNPHVLPPAPPNFALRAPQVLSPNPGPPLTLRMKSGGVPGRTVGRSTPSWWEWIKVSSRSKTRIFLFTWSGGGQRGGSGGIKRGVRGPPTLRGVPTAPPRAPTHHMSLPSSQSPPRFRAVPARPRSPLSQFRGSPRPASPRLGVPPTPRQGMGPPRTY